MILRYCLPGLGCFVLLLCAGCDDAPPRTVIVVEAVYPGASAQVLADTVAAPIEQEVNGVEKMQSMRSRCTSDGRYVLTIAFGDGIEAAMAQVLVQNRVALAQRILPDLVNAGGLTVKTKPAAVLVIVSLSSPEGRFDARYLNGYAALQIKDELARIPGVGGITLLPERDEGHRVWLDVNKLEARKITADDVADALKAQNLDVKKGPRIGDVDMRLDVNAMGRLQDAAQFEDIIVNNAGGLKIRLGDVARVERLGDRRLNWAQLNGKEVALLVIAPTPKARPRELTPAVTKKLALLEKHLPDGLRVDLAFDFSANVETPGKSGAPEYLLLDVDVPADATPQRAAKILGSCDKIVRDVDGVKDVLTLTANPFDDAASGPSILVRLAPAGERKTKREEIAATIRARLQEKAADATVRVRGPLGAGLRAGWGYPVDLAIHGPEAEQVRKLAAKLAERMRQEKKLTDVWLDRASALRPQLDVVINREQAAKLGVTLTDIQAVLEIHRADAAPGKQLENLKRLKIRNERGEMIALSTLVTAREIASAAAVDRLHRQPMVRITANPAPGASAADARALCETLLGTVREELGLPADYRLSVFPAK